MRFLNANFKNYSQFIWIYLISLNLIKVIFRKLILLNKILIFDFIDKYTSWLIFKFIQIAKIAKFTLKQLTKIIIEDTITFLKKKFWSKYYITKKPF